MGVKVVKPTTKCNSCGILFKEHNMPGIFKKGCRCFKAPDSCSNVEDYSLSTRSKWTKGKDEIKELEKEIKPSKKKE